MTRALLLALLPLAALAAPRQYAPAELRQSLLAPQVEAQRVELKQVIARSDWPALHVHFNGVLAKAQADPLVAEYLLREALIALRAERVPADVAASVQALTAHRAQALRPPVDPDHGRGHWIAAYDVAAAARGTLRAWELRDHSERALRLIATAPDRVVEIEDAAALAAAIEQASPQSLENLRAHAPHLPSRALAALARRLASAALYATLFERTGDSSVLAALAEAAGQLPAGEAQRTLHQAALNPELASAAMLALAQVPGSERALLQCLGDPVRGGGCAQGLARQPDAAPELLALIEQGRDDLATRRALLALLWMNDRAARANLAAYADSTNMPARLRAEVAGWLR